ncbi:MAG TPA: GC-type dockerin domain-anchored protein [Phycisphaerales bacterium]|nr:GC-type dockerin domain-anchored protein [Phycisphaerales bacterium]
MTRSRLLFVFVALLPAAIASAQPFNNFCQSAQPVVERLYDFDMTDGVNTSTSTCDAPGVSPPEIWFDYTPAATGTATVSTCGLGPYVPHLPVTLTAFADCAGPQITCASGNCADGQSEISFPVLAAQHYYIRVASATSAFATGGIVFRVIADCPAAPPGAPANDCCSDATPITLGSWPFTTVNATRDFWSDYDLEYVDNPDVWFDFTAPASGFVKVRPGADSPADLAVAVLDGSCAGREIACDCDNLVGDNSVRQLVFATLAGHHYLIRFRGIAFDPADAFVSGHFSVTTATPPPNDECINATPISGVGTFVYDNTLANNSGPDDQIICDSYFGGPGLFQDVWFRWTSDLPAGQDAVISTVESPQIETKIAVYTDNCNVGEALDCNDRVSSFFSQSRVSFTPTPGASYLIRVGSRPNIENELPPQGRPGFFTISTQRTCTITAPPGAFVEPEACGQDINGGCATNQFTDIPCGTTTIFGTAPVINGVPDLDFYRVVLPVATHVSFNGYGEVPIRLVVLDDQCDFIAGRAFPFSPCDDQSEPLEADVPAGTVYFAVESARPDSPCDRKNNYLVTIAISACEPSGRCCAGAACTVMPHSVCLASGGAYAGDDTTCPPAGGNYVPSSCSDAFEDISATGAPGPACDDCGLVVPLGFPFAFYGQTFSSVHVSSNGFLCFDDNTYDGSWPPFSLPDPYVTSVIAPWWANLDPTAGGQIFTATLGAAPNRRFIAEWSAVQNSGLPGAGVTFEAVLFEGTNRIAFRYGSVNLDVVPTIITVGSDSTVIATLDQSTLGTCTTLTLTPSTNPCCRADFNGDGSIAVQDIFDFLNAWFAGDLRADFNGGGLAVQDIFDYLNAWFAGC